MSRVGKSLAKPRLCRIGLLALLEQHLDLMPMTRDYLAMVTESIEDFQIRRIRWAVNELSQGRSSFVLAGDETSWIGGRY